MSVTSRHPEYTADRKAEWDLMRRSYDGESAIKARAELYLPKPDGWKALTTGDAMYAAYMARARFPEIVSNTIRGMVGIVHGQDWQYEIPGIEFIEEKATKDGLTLDMFQRRITTELLTTGRYSVLAEAPVGGGDPYLAGYAAESLVNWDNTPGEEFYVLEELENRRNQFTWSQVTRSRVLTLNEGRYVQQIYDDGDPIEEIEPRSGRRSAPLPFIPLVVGGAMDMDLRPDTPPLIGVARAALAHYQIYADYRLALYMAYQDTLVIHNAEETPTAVGAGTVISLKSSDVGKETKAEYVAPSGTSIEAHERGMDREQQSAVRSGASMFDNTPRGQESGEARRLRFSAETATVQSIVGASAAIMERALRNLARINGIENTDGITVNPPRNLLEGRLEPQEVQALVAAWEAGAFGHETLYENLQRGRIASMERTFEDELKLLDAPAADAAVV